MGTHTGGVDAFQNEDIPEELISPPEKRLVGTLLTTQPNPKSFMVTAITLLVVLLVSQLHWLNPWGWAELLPVVKRLSVHEGQWWRFFTATLIHGDMEHLLSNLYMLGILSYFVYGYFGFLSYPVFTFLGAGLVNYFSILTYPMDLRLLGASGWVYLLGGFWLSLYLFIQRQHRFGTRLLRVAGMALMVFFPTTFEPTTSYRAHFIGFMVGAAMGIYYFLRHRSDIRAHETYRMVG